MKFCLLYTTFETISDAKIFARLLLEKNLCVCVNILPSFSLFKDEGENVEREEQIMLIKTILGKKEEIQKVVMTEHPFSCPCLLEIQASSISEPFNAWIQDSLKV